LYGTPQHIFLQVISVAELYLFSYCADTRVCMAGFEIIIKVITSREVKT